MGELNFAVANQFDMVKHNEVKKGVTVIGLGQMGTRLASLLMKANYRVTVWNRTASRAKDLVKEGAKLAEDIASAIHASSVVVVCVFDYQAAKQVFQGQGAETALKGKTIIQFTTGSPDDATEGESWAHKHGAGYLDGAIQVAPEQMAKPDTTIFISGDTKVFNAVESMLKVFGGNIKYLGDKASAASAMDLASLSYLYGSLLGFFHAVRICDMENFRIDTFGEIIKEIAPNFTEFIQYQASVIQSGDFAITQSPLAISVEATERIQQASLAYGINTEVPQLAARFMKRAKEQGYAREELASLIKIFRGLQ